MISGVLLDLSGVLYSGDQPLPGAADALARLRGSGLPLGFVTNTTSAPKRRIVERLDTMGLTVAPDELFTPAMAARRRLVERNLRPHLMIAEALEEDFAGLSGGDGEAVVVGDVGERLSFRMLNAAYRKLAAGAAFLALAKNRAFQDTDGENSLDTGAFVAALEFASRREADVMGKPAPAFFTAAAESLGQPPRSLAMIGDDAESDVAGALSAGIGQAVLARSGKYQPGDEDRVSPRPSAVVDDVAAAVDWVLARRAP